MIELLLYQETQVGFTKIKEIVTHDICLSLFVCEGSADVGVHIFKARLLVVVTEGMDFQCRV